jgi:hypothetical protein
VIVAARLDENVEDLAILVDGPSQVHALASDRDEHFVEVPEWMSGTSMVAQAAGDLRPELGNPPADGFVGDDDAALGKQTLDVAEAQGKPSRARPCAG